MKVLYITTFNKNLYEKSGKDLIDSFLNKTTESHLLVCFEDFNFECDSDRVISYNIENDTFMNTWIKNNASVIPVIFGGTALDNDPIFLEDKEKGQCWARYRAAGYFRKIVTLNYAITKYSNDYDVISIIDSDCIFKNKFGPNMQKILQTM